jgi:quercetin dioxygenase-like cupin family protein
MAIIEQLQHNPFDDSDYPDDYRPNSTWAIACDPSNVEGSYAADLAVAVEVVAPGDRVPSHTHPIDELIFVEDGVAEVELGPETRTVQPGTIVFVPAGTPHAGRPVGDSSVRFLGVFPSPQIGIEMLDRNPAPGTEGDPPQPAYTWDIRQEFESRN